MSHIYETKFNLFELYSFEELKKLLKVIPEITSLYNQIKKESEKINVSYYQTKINKFPFFKIILSKLKSYFEVNESFIIMRTLSIMINEIENLEKFFILNSHSQNSKNKNKKEQKSGSKNQRENKSFKKFEKVKRNNNYKNIETTRTTDIKKNINPNLNLNNLSNIFNVNANNNKKKVYFRVLDSQIHKESKTEINSFNSKSNNNNTNTNSNNINNKNSEINLNESERKISNSDLSLSNLKKLEYQKVFGKQKSPSQLGFKIFLDSNNNNTHTHNFSTTFDTNMNINTNSDNNSNKKSNFKNYIKNAEKNSDLFNNNNNLYINIYGDKKNKINITEPSSINLEAKTNAEINTLNNINNFNYLNISLLNNIESKDFDIFELDKKTSKNILPLIGGYIFNRFGFHNIMKYTMFGNWCKKIAEGYSRKNPYHTDLHAADVTQTCLIFFKIGKINEICKLNQLSKCALFLSCICHDFKHPGVNNDFLKETKNILAIKYNDNSILENMHISEAFKLTLDYPNCDIFSGMNLENYKQMRKEMISCVLFTCMSKHAVNNNFMKELINKKNINNNINNTNNINNKDNNNNINNKDNKKDNNNINNNKTEETDIHQNYMNLLIHSADISNPTKKFEIYWKWADLVVEEFFQQGEKEKELGIKCSFDRETMTEYQNQLGFINYIALPHYNLFVTNFPKLKYLLENLNYNKNKILSLQSNEKKNENIKNNANKK